MISSPPPLCATTVTRDFITKFGFVSYSPSDTKKSLESSINTVVTYELYVNFLPTNAKFDQKNLNVICNNFNDLDSSQQEEELKNCRQWLLQHVDMNDLDKMGLDEQLIDTWISSIEQDSYAFTHIYICCHFGIFVICSFFFFLFFLFFLLFFVVNE